MALLNAFNIFTFDVLAGNHAFTQAGSTYKIALSNTAPVATSSKFSNITEIAATNGYVAGGNVVVPTMTLAGATTTIFCPNTTFIAAGGSIPAFRYVIFYRNAPATLPSLKPLIGWWDYGSSLVLAPGDSFIVDFNLTTGVLQVT